MMSLLRIVVLCNLLAVGCGWQCTTDLDLGSVTLSESKGLAVDDTTFANCSGKLPQLWPNTKVPVQSLRLFKTWDLEWSESDRLPAWDNLISYIKSNNIKVLLGTSISCNTFNDTQSWTWTKQFLSRLRPSDVMGLAIGNELEMLSIFGKEKPELQVTPACLDRIFRGGYFWTTFQQVVAEFDALGFSSVPVTSVFGGYSLAGDPFINTAEAGILDFLRSAVATYGSRYAFTFNFYPYFDGNMWLDSSTTCWSALRFSTCWRGNCNVPVTIKAARARVTQLTGRNDATFWLGETGWSSPQSPSLSTRMRSCAAWSSADTFQTFYKGFLDWDLGVDGVKAPDHVFYFTVRNSFTFKIPEFFGLASTCEAESCKLSASALKAESGPGGSTVDAAVSAQEAVGGPLGSFPPGRLVPSPAEMTVFP